MSDGFDEVYVDTRCQLRGVAESLIAGPQYRASGTIRLAVRPNGFAGVSFPLAVHGTELVWPDGGAPLAGPVDPLPTDAFLRLDTAAADWIHRSHYAGGHAIKKVLPEAHPVLGPEHFDVAAAEDEVNYGVSAGDDYHPTPYAYVAPWTARIGPFWNAPFGAVYPLDPAHDVDALALDIADFFQRGRKEL